MVPQKIEVTNKETGEIRVYTEYEFIAERDRRLQVWEASKLALEIAKENEMKFRKEAVDFAFDPTKKAGTERVELGGGWIAKAVKKINYGWIKDGEKVNKHAIDDILDKIEKTIENGGLIAERLVKWTPDLSLTEYKLLPEAAKALIDTVIVTSEGAPTLEIIPPKGTK
jgi:hypothetical protein